MWGYIVNFYKYATFPSNLKPEMRAYLNQSRKTERTSSLLVYGDYDRLNVERIDQFLRFRDVDHYAQRWMGPRQSVLLYRLPTPAAFWLPNGVEDLLELFCQPCEEKKVHFDQRNFLVFTMVTLDPRLHRYCDFRQILEHCCQLISTQVHSRDVELIQPDQIFYQVYGSFSSSELVIVWYVDQYADALRLVDMLRYASFVVNSEEPKESILPFVSLYSIIAQDRQGRQDNSAWHSPQIEGNAELRFAFQDGLRDSDELEQFLLMELKGMLCQQDESIAERITCMGHRNAGIYDYSICIPAFLLCDPGRNVFQRGKPLHWDQDNVSRFFSLTYVQLYYDMADDKRPASVSRLCPELSPAFHDTGGTLRHHVELISKMVYGPERFKEESRPGLEVVGTEESAQGGLQMTCEEMLDAYRKQGLRYVIKELIPSTDGLCDSLDLLYSDFVNNCSNLTSSAWAEDLTIQFIAIIDYIAEQFYHVCQGKKSDLFFNFKSICEIYIQMIYHIAQSRRTVFIVPSCHLRYMGQYDMILHAYYGWVKCLLDLAYSLHHNNGFQHSLIPVLTIDVIPEICVCRYTVCHHFDESESTSSIFSINLPLVAMTDFLRYSMVICHETAHLIIPHDRDRRNQVMGMLFFSEFVANMVLAEKELELNAEPKDSVQLWRYNRVLGNIKKRFMTVVYNGLRPYYIESLHNVVMYRLRDAETTWENYRTELVNELGSLLQVNETVAPLIQFLADNEAVLREAISISVAEATPWNEMDEVFDAKGLCSEIQTAVNEALLGASSSRVQVLIRKYKMLLNLNRWQNIYRESLCISSAYREASQDLFMIRIFGLDVEDYLVFLDRHRHDSGRLEDRLPQVESLRISMVCDYLLTPAFEEGQAPQDAMLTLAEFDQRGDSYVELFMSVPEMQGQVKKDPLACQQRIRGYFRAARECLVQYYDQFAFVRGLLLLQLRDTDVLNETQELRDKVAGAKMGTSYRDWKTVIMKKASSSSPEKTLRIKHEVFDIQVELIQRFQTQETLKDLSSKLRECDNSDGKA